MPLGENHMTKYPNPPQEEEKRVDFGSGGNKTKAPGHIGIDITPLEGVDIVMSLDDPNLKLPFEDNSITAARAHQFVEHITNIIPFMNEAYRVLKPGGLIEFSTPIAGSNPFWQDPTHKRGFIKRTFDYFCDDQTTEDAREEYGITSKFKMVDSWIENEWNLQIRLEK